MSDQSNQSTKLEKYIEAAILMNLVLLIIIGVAIFCYAIERLDILLPFGLLFGVWLIDVIMKLAFEFSNETAFADLSFVSFMFVVSQLLPQQTAQQTTQETQTDRTTSVELLVLWIIGLALIWIVNLYISGGLANENSNDPLRRWLILLSVFFAALSVIAVMLAKYINLI